MDITMSDDLKTRLLANAARQGKSVQEFAQEALYTYVEDIEDGVLSDVVLTDEGLQHLLLKGWARLAWTIEYSKLAEKQLKKFPEDVENRIRQFMAERVAPQKHPQEMGKRLSGPYENRIRFRVGDYRVICVPNQKILLILVVEVAHRREVYR